MIFHQKEDRSRCVPRLLGVRSCSLANTGLAYMIGMIACDAKFPIVELICLKLGQKTEFEEYSPVERGGGEPGEMSAKRKVQSFSSVLDRTKTMQKSFALGLLGSRRRTL